MDAKVRQIDPFVDIRYVQHCRQIFFRRLTYTVIYVSVYGDSRKPDVRQRRRQSLYRIGCVNRSALRKRRQSWNSRNRKVRFHESCIKCHDTSRSIPIMLRRIELKDRGYGIRTEEVLLPSSISSGAWPGIRLPS